jgi:hypothetical protein
MGGLLSSFSFYKYILFSGVDSHLDYVYYYPTHRKIDGQIMWGGYDKDSGILCGASRVYFSDAMVSQRLIAAVIAVGGGRISRGDIRYALHIHVPVAWIKAKAKYPSSLWDGTEETGSDWGPVIDFIQLLKDKGALIAKDSIWYFVDDEFANVLEM